MQLSRDGRVILELDDSAGTNHISAQIEHFPPSWLPSPTQPSGQRLTSMISSRREGAFSIKFESLESYRS